MNIGCCRLAILLLSIAGMFGAQRISDFGGTWVLKLNGQAIFDLTLSAQRGGIIGSLTRPRQLTIDQDGGITMIGPDQVRLPIRKAALKAGRLEMIIDADRFVMTMEDRNRALLVMQSMRPWRLERIPDGASVVLASKLPEPEYPQEIRALREEVRSMVQEDQEARLAFDQSRIEAADAENRPELLRIFNQYGWVTNSLAGNETAHNFWLLVQHQTPEIQQQLLPALEKAALSGNASMSDYAYLYDRVQMGRGKPQHWGTQATCENSKPMLYPADDPAGLDMRRKALFMLPIRQYLRMDYLVRPCAQTGK